MKSYEIGIKSFLNNPFIAVRKGYKPSVLDCWSYSANNIEDVFSVWFKNIKDFLRHFWNHNSVKENLVEFIAILFYGVLTLSFPFLFWVWGTAQWFILEGERERYLKQLGEEDEHV